MYTTTNKNDPSLAAQLLIARAKSATEEIINNSLPSIHTSTYLVRERGRDVRQILTDTQDAVMVGVCDGYTTGPSQLVSRICDRLNQDSISMEEAIQKLKLIRKSVDVADNGRDVTLLKSMHPISGVLISLCLY